MISLDRINFYFEYLHTKARSAPHRLIHHNGYDIKALYFQKDEYCKWLYQTYQKKDFKFSTLNRKKIKVGAKERFIFQYPLADLIIHYCIAEYIKLKTAPYLIDNLFSYRKGKSSNLALNLVNQFVRKYKNGPIQNIKNRGLFVIRKDISEFSDSIDSHQDSNLWSMFKSEIKDLPISDQVLIAECLNPLYKDETDTEDKRLMHLPMGSPVVGHLTNFYLCQMDRELCQEPHSLYIRFGDDILFITDNYDQYKKADQKILEACHDKKLKFNIKKSYTTYLTSPGCPYPNDLSLRKSNFFEYLGMKVSFDYGLTLNNEKYKKVFSELRNLLKNYSKNSQSLGLQFSLSEKTQCIVNEVNKILELNSEKSLIFLDQMIKNIDHHTILKKIDLEIATEIIHHLKRSRVGKNLRSEAYGHLRRQYKLRSLVKYKNEYYKNR